MAQPDRPPMTWRRPTACWTSKHPPPTHTHKHTHARTKKKEYAIAFPRQWLHERFSILRYTYSYITYLIIAKLVFTARYELDV